MIQAIIGQDLQKACKGGAGCQDEKEGCPF
jgi:hypothetical protein